MSEVSPKRIIVLDDYIDVSQVRVLDRGPLLQLLPEPGREAEVYRLLRGAHPKLTVYRKGELPERFRFNRHRRIPPIVGIPEVGWSVQTRRSMGRIERGELKGEHAYNNEHPEMGGIFLAAGPGIRPGSKLPAFSAVHVYELLAALLGIEAAPNDGDPAVLAPILAR